MKDISSYQAGITSSNIFVIAMQHDNSWNPIISSWKMNKDFFIFATIHFLVWTDYYFVERWKTNWSCCHGAARWASIWSQKTCRQNHLRETKQNTGSPNMIYNSWHADKDLKNYYMKCNMQELYWQTGLFWSKVWPYNR